MSAEKRYIACIRKIIKDAVRISEAKGFAIFGLKEITKRMQGISDPAPIVIAHWKTKLPGLLTDIMEFPEGPKVHGAPVNKRARGMKAMPETEADAKKYLAIGNGNRVDGLVLSPSADGALLVAYCRHRTACMVGIGRQTIRRLTGAASLLTASNLAEAKSLLPGVTSKLLKG